MKTVQIICIFALIGIQTLTAQNISKEEATLMLQENVLQNNYRNKNIYTYPSLISPLQAIPNSRQSIIAPDCYSWFFFVDDYPQARWSHPCKFIFIDANNGQEYVIEGGFPPNMDNMEIVYQSQLPFNEIPSSPPPPLHFQGADSNCKNPHQYAVIINGGGDSTENYQAFWNDCSAMYTLLLNTYNYDRSKIYVLMADGTDPENDMCYQEGSTIFYSSDPDLDGDRIDDIQYAATRANLSKVFDTLSQIITHDDNVFIFFSGHGERDIWNPGKRSYLSLWAPISTPEAYLYPDELAIEINKINAAKTINILMGNCYSGGFIPALRGNNRVITTSIPDSMVGNREPGYVTFVHAWESAVNGKERWSEYPIDADLNADGFVSMYEAVQYTRSQRGGCSLSQYASDPPELGEKLSLWGFITPFEIIGRNTISYYCYEVYSYELKTNYFPDCSRILWKCSDNIEILSDSTDTVITIQPKDILHNEAGWLKAVVKAGNSLLTEVVFNINIIKKDSIDQWANYSSQGDYLIDRPETSLGDFIINAPDIVTIRNTDFYVGSGYRIIVEPGAKLIVENSKITTLCQDWDADYTSWEGIEVRGDSKLEQNAKNQGVVELYNAHIENAKCGIYVGNSNGVNDGGGIVTAVQTTFKNNKKSVEFSPYTSRDHQGKEINNISSFSQCTFITDHSSVFSSIQDLRPMVNLFGVRGIRFVECDFVNKKDWRPYPLSEGNQAFVEIGIYANNSGVLLDGLGCKRIGSRLINMPHKYNTFYNFYHAILIENAGTKVSRIEFSNFEKNHIAITGKAAHHVEIITCNFDVTSQFDPWIFIPANVGIYLEQTTHYTIENNTFAGKYGSGIYINASGEADNLVQYNTFSNTCNATYTLLKNGKNTAVENELTGLQYLCNQFENNRKDIELSNIKHSYMRTVQGKSSSGAGNVFKNTSYWNIYDENAEIAHTYYFCSLRSEQIPQQIYSRNNKFVPIPVNLSTCKFFGATGKEYYGIGSLSWDDGILIKLENQWQILNLEYKEMSGNYKNNYPDPIPWENITTDPYFFEADLYKEWIQLADFRFELSQTCKDAFRAIYSYDAPYFERELYEVWLQRDNTLKSNYQLVFNSLETDNFQEAMEYYNGIPKQISQIDNIEYHTLGTYFSIYQNASLSNHLNPSDKLKLIEISGDANAGEAAIKAQALLVQYRENIKPVFLDLACDCEDETNQGEESPRQKRIGNNPTNDSVANVDPFIIVYPNPTNGMLYIQLSDAEEIFISKIDIYNMSGQLLVTSSPNNCQTEIQTNMLSAGIYFIKSTLSNGMNKSGRFVKQ